MRKWRRVYGFIPVAIYYTDNLEAGVGGRFRWQGVKWPWIEIRPSFENDEGIHRHEMEHARQSFTLLVFGHGVLYNNARWYRQWAEVQAYKQQMKYPDRNGNLLPIASAAARLMSPHYGLGLTTEKAMELLA